VTSPGRYTVPAWPGTRQGRPLRGGRARVLLPDAVDLEGAGEVRKCLSGTSRTATPSSVGAAANQLDRGLGFGSSPSAPRSSSVCARTPVAGMPTSAAVPPGRDGRRRRVMPRTTTARRRYLGLPCTLSVVPRTLTGAYNRCWRWKPAGNACSEPPGRRADGPCESNRKVSRVA
jgi:hypothetical protein